MTHRVFLICTHLSKRSTVSFVGNEERVVAEATIAHSLERNVSFDSARRNCFGAVRPLHKHNRAKSCPALLGRRGSNRQQFIQQLGSAFPLLIQNKSPKVRSPPYQFE